MKQVRERQISCNITYNITYKWNLKKNDTNELIYKTELDSQTQKRNLWLPQGKGGGRDKLGIQDEQKHSIMHKIDKQQGPTVQHRELYVQYLVMTYNGKEFKYIYFQYWNILHELYMNLHEFYMNFT